jgi:hypothetical protein
VGTIKVKGNIGTATGKRFFLPGLLFVSRYTPFRHAAKGEGFCGSNKCSK